MNLDNFLHKKAQNRYLVFFLFHYLFNCLFFALISVLFEIPVKSSTCLYEWVSNSLKACSICFFPYFLGLPSLKSSRSLAMALPSWVRSTIISLSNSAKALITLNTSRPVGVFSTSPMFKIWTFTPLSNSSVTMWPSTSVRVTRGKVNLFLLIQS